MRHLRESCRWVHWLAVTIVCMVLMVPFGDVATFGFHEHMASAATEPGELTPLSGTGHVTHHCDFSMNPAEVAPESDLPGPIFVAVVGPEMRPSELSDASFDLLIPPRA